MTTPDPLNAATALVETLEAEGMSAEAAALSNCIAAGATGTEILMCLRARLQTLVASTQLSTRANDQANLTLRLIKRLLA